MMIMEIKKQNMKLKIIGIGKDDVVLELPNDITYKGKPPKYMDIEDVKFLYDVIGLPSHVVFDKLTFIF